MACTGNYYINTVEGTIQQQCNSVLAAALKDAGFDGPYDSIADAKAAVTPDTDAASQAVDTLASSLGPLVTIGNFFGTLTQGATWIRFIEIALGVTVVLVALNALAGDPAGQAASVAAKAAVVA
jgi:hypothetical protein